VQFRFSVSGDLHYRIVIRAMDPIRASAYSQSQRAKPTSNVTIHRKQQIIFNLQVNRMPQMPTLPNSASKSIPRLEDRDFDAMLQ
jgi:hypothetical protein